MWRMNMVRKITQKKMKISTTITTTKPKQRQRERGGSQNPSSKNSSKAISLEFLHQISNPCSNKLIYLPLSIFVLWYLFCISIFSNVCSLLL